MPVYQFKNLIIQILLTLSALSGISKSVEPEPICALPKALKENSGMVAWGDSLLWLINDSGNDPKLFAVNLKCEILKEVWIKNAENIDWEDLTKDEEGNIYIGDIGNNSNMRRSLVIYKLSKQKLMEYPDTIEPMISICFFYKNQDKYPPESGQKYFDAEALYFCKDSLSLITKNRTYPFDGKAYLYRIPIIEGNHPLMPKDSLFTGKGLMELHWIAGADLLNDSLILAIGYDKIFVAAVNNLIRIKSINLNMWNQFESIAVGEKYIYISNEKNRKSKAFLFRVDKEKLLNLVSKD